MNTSCLIGSFRISVVVFSVLSLLAFLAVAVFFMNRGGGDSAKEKQADQGIACVNCPVPGSGQDVAAATFSGKAVRVSETDIIVEADGVTPRTFMIDAGTKVSREQCRKLSPEEQEAIQQGTVGGVVSTESCERIEAVRGDIGAGQTVVIVLGQAAGQSEVAREVIIAFDRQ